MGGAGGVGGAGEEASSSGSGSEAVGRAAVHLVRHAYLGKGEGGDCWVDVQGSACGHPYWSVHHYNDLDHPYQLGEPGTVNCQWILQNPEDALRGAVCGRAANADVHERARREASAGSVMGGLWLVRPPDEAAAAEAEGAGDGSWSLNENVVAALSAPGSFLSGHDVTVGPWQVRQWRVEAVGGRFPEGCTRLLGALWLAGEPYELFTWWADGGRARVVRLVWGQMLGLDETGIADRMNWLGGSG